MNSLQKARQLDCLLGTIRELKSPDTIKLLKYFPEMEHSQISLVCQQFRERGYVSLIETASKGHRETYVVSLTSKGENFLFYEGGFRKQFFKDFLTQIWSIVKISAAVVNSAAILLLSYMSYDHQRQKDDRDIKIQEQEKLIHLQEVEEIRLNRQLAIAKDSLAALFESRRYENELKLAKAKLEQEMKLRQLEREK
jgi:hypothetical protein